MKKHNLNILLLFFVGMMLVFSIMPNVSAATNTYYRENFADEATWANPVSSAAEGAWYAYAEFGYTNASVNAADQFYINQSDSAVTGWSNFTFNTSLGYNYFDFSFYYLNEWGIKNNHSSIEYRLRGDVGDIAFIRIYGANHSVTSQQNKIIILDFNSVERVNVSIAKDKWYTVRLDPDYDTWDDTVTITVLDVTAASNIVNTDIDLNSNTQLTKFYIYTNNDKTCILTDTLLLLQTVYTQGETTTNYLAQYIIPIIFAAGLLVVIIGMATADVLTAKSFIMIVVVAILGVVILQIITSI